jgi:hypothetical protein
MIMGMLSGSSAMGIAALSMMLSRKAIVSHFWHMSTP